jgi:hypothetical protein
MKTPLEISNLIFQRLLVAVSGTHGGWLEMKLDREEDLARQSLSKAIILEKPQKLQKINYGHQGALRKYIHRTIHTPPVVV